MEGLIHLKENSKMQFSLKCFLQELGTAGTSKGTQHLKEPRKTDIPLPQSHPKTFFFLNLKLDFFIAFQNQPV